MLGHRAWNANAKVGKAPEAQRETINSLLSKEPLKQKFDERGSALLAEPPLAKRSTPSHNLPMKTIEHSVPSCGATEKAFSDEKAQKPGIEKMARIFVGAEVYAKA